MDPKWLEMVKNLMPPTAGSNRGRGKARGGGRGRAGGGPNTEPHPGPAVSGSSVADPAANNGGVPRGRPRGRPRGSRGARGRPPNRNVVVTRATRRQIINYSDNTDDLGDGSDSEDSLKDSEDSDSSDEYILPKAVSRNQSRQPRSRSEHSTRANPRFPHDDGRDGFESSHNLKSDDDSRTNDNSESQPSSSSSSSSSDEDEDEDINYRPSYYVKRRTHAHLRSSPRVQGRLEPVSEERDELDSIEEEEVVVDVKQENELHHSVEENEPVNAVDENELDYVVDVNQLDYVMKMGDEPDRTVEEEELGSAEEDELDNDAEPLSVTIKNEPGEPGDDIASAYHNPEQVPVDPPSSDIRTPNLRKRRREHTPPPSPPAANHHPHNQIYHPSLILAQVQNLARVAGAIGHPGGPLTWRADSIPGRLQSRNIVYQAADRMATLVTAVGTGATPVQQASSIPARQASGVPAPRDGNAPALPTPGPSARQVVGAPVSLPATAAAPPPANAPVPQAARDPAHVASHTPRRLAPQSACPCSPVRPVRRRGNAPPRDLDVEAWTLRRPRVGEGRVASGLASSTAIRRNTASQRPQAGLMPFVPCLQRRRVIHLVTRFRKPGRQAIRSRYRRGL
ncbi:hypothetical protein CspHIS471_0701940 [Cutaneotrichosporon sp. HIS471]|nr:hypothetical protein CspHIS471_0701940 [Cutaneotrichosporon sp. HIS471]